MPDDEGDLELSDLEQVERWMEEAMTTPRPGDAEYLTALAPTPTPALLPTGETSGDHVPWPIFKLQDELGKEKTLRLEVERQLAEAKALPTGIPARIGELVHGEPSGEKLGDLYDEPTKRERELEAELAEAKAVIANQHESAATNRRELERQLGEAKAALADYQGKIRIGIDKRMDEYNDRCRSEVAELQAALDEAKNAILSAQCEEAAWRGLAHMAEDAMLAAQKKIEDLQAALDREKEASAKAFELATAMVADANAKRLRAETGAAWWYMAMNAIAKDEALACRCGEEPYTDGEQCPKCHAICCMEIAPSTGTRLAAVLEEVRKMPCQKDFKNGLDCIANHNYDPCARCKVVDAIGERT